MRYKDNEICRTHKNELLEWERVNAVEYVRKDNIAEQEKQDNRVIVIEDRCVCVSVYFCQIYITKGRLP